MGREPETTDHTPTPEAIRNPELESPRGALGITLTYALILVLLWGYLYLEALAMGG